MIRSLAEGELEWFLAASYTFLAHSDPRGLARRAVGMLRDPGAEADRAFVLTETGMPLAGAYLLAPEPDADDQNLYLSNVWFSRQADDLYRLIDWLLRKHAHEAAHFPLHNFAEEAQRKVVPVFERLGFRLETACDMTFELAGVPPLGLPLVLEAWTEENDTAFKRVYTAAEGSALSERGWAYLKRWRGAFHPDFWFIARETLDQEPVGYAFFGAHRTGLDGVYYLTAAGVLMPHRTSTEMLRRLVLSSMHELASRSPLGSIRMTVLERDPKLIRIFESLGFDSTSRYQTLMKWPL